MGSEPVSGLLWPLRRAQAEDDGWDLLNTPARLPHRMRAEHDCKGLPCRSGTRPPATIPSPPPRLSWPAHASLASERAPFATSAVTVAFYALMSVSSAGGTELDCRSDRSGAKAGIEPAVDADLISYFGIAEDVHDAPHLCVIDAH
jgi:hypothetical protein